jgi:hypothetical protein
MRVHQDEGEQQGQRNHRGDDDGRPQVAQEDQQDGGDQHRADQQVLADGGHGVADQLGALVDRADPVAFRQACIDLVHLGAQGLDDLGRVAALGHLHDAFDDVVAVVEGHDAGAARTGAVFHFCHVADAHRLAFAGHHHHVAHVVEALEQAQRAHHQGFVAAAQQAAAAIAAGAARAWPTSARLTELAQQVGLDAHLHLADRAAEADHVGDARHHAQGRADGPVLHGADLLAVGGGASST